MSKIDWDNAPEGYPIWLEYAPDVAARKKKAGCWVKDSGDRYYEQNDNYWTKPEEGYYTVHERPLWRGSEDGLPPIGLECEVMHCEEWKRCEIIAHFMQRAGMVAAYTVYYPIGDGAKALDSCSADYFRLPQPTPEQIAAEEREKAIREMAYVLREEADSSEYYAARALYDAGFGFRKQPSQPGEDMTDWRNWKAGDLVECVTDPHRDGITVGTTYELIGADGSTINFLDDDGDERTRSSSNFRWHSRPSA